VSVKVEQKSVRGSAMTILSIRQRQAKDITVIDLKGDITIGEGASALSSVIKSLMEQGKFKILLNLAGVRYVDSVGLGNLITGYTRLRKEGGELKLLNVTENVLDILVITKLVTVFEVFDDEAAAINSF
jgi:anti-sigma B factor antagonist